MPSAAFTVLHLINMRKIWLVWFWTVHEEVVTNLRVLTAIATLVATFSIINRRRKPAGVCALCMESIRQPLSRSKTSVSQSRFRVSRLINCMGLWFWNHGITSAALRVAVANFNVQHNGAGRSMRGWASLNLITSSPHALEITDDPGLWRTHPDRYHPRVIQ
jgi:hypothetical protein